MHGGILAHYLSLNLSQNEFKRISSDLQILIQLPQIKEDLCHVKPGLITQSHPQVSFLETLNNRLC